MPNHTHYFARSYKLPLGNTAISISLWPPKGWFGKRYPALAPTKSILDEYKQTNDWPRYIDRYNNEVLAKLDPKKVYNDLKTLANGKDFTLCCFEKDPYKCHRSLVAQWLDENLSDQPGYKQITEFGTNLTF